MQKLWLNARAIFFIFRNINTAYSEESNTAPQIQ